MTARRSTPARTSTSGRGVTKRDAPAHAAVEPLAGVDGPVTLLAPSGSRLTVNDPALARTLLATAGHKLAD